MFNLVLITNQATLLLTLVALVVLAFLSFFTLQKVRILNHNLQTPLAQILNITALLFFGLCLVTLLLAGQLALTTLKLFL